MKNMKSMKEGTLVPFFMSFMLFMVSFSRATYLPDS